MSLKYIYMLSHKLLHKPWPYKILVNNVVSKVALPAVKLYYGSVTIILEGI